MRQRAVISECGSYRYVLERFWADYGKAPSVLTACMLNPSTADASKDDATIRWLIGWAKKHGYDGLRVVNLAAFRATSPRDMLTADDPHGPENGAYLTRYCGARPVLCAWGANGIKLPRYQEMLSAMETPYLHAIATNNDGSPSHPLRKSHSLELSSWRPETRVANP